MITINKNGNNYNVSFPKRPPSIYLDHWALRHFSSNHSDRQQFLAFLKTKGTVFFSYLNVVEISKNKGESLKEIQFFLTDIGENWCPIESDPHKVIEREKQYVHGDNCPFLAKSFINAYYPHIHGGPLSLSKIVSLVQDKQGNSLLLQSHQSLEGFAQFINSAREKLRLGQMHLSIPSFNPQHPTEFVYESLKNLILKETFKFDKTDSCDFFHATVALANSNIVLLDKHWTDLAKKIKLPENHVKVYSQSQLDQFLQKFEQW